MKNVFSIPDSAKNARKGLFLIVYDFFQLKILKVFFG